MIMNKLSKIFITRPLPMSVMDEAKALGSLTARNLTSPLSEKEMILADHQAGLSIRKIATKHNRNRSFVHRIVKEVANA